MRTLLNFVLLHVSFQSEKIPASRIGCLFATNTYKLVIGEVVFTSLNEMQPDYPRYPR
jgi:hypothetical protein